MVKTKPFEVQAQQGILSTTMLIQYRDSLKKKGSKFIDIEHSWR